MILNADSLAKKVISTEDSNKQSFTAGVSDVATHTKTERQLTAILHDIEVEPATFLPPVQDIRHRPDRLLQAFIATDLIALVIGFAAAWYLSSSINNLFLSRTALDQQTNSLLIVALQFGLTGAGILLWFGYTGHYQLRLPFWSEVKKVVETAGFAMLVSCFIQFTSKQNFSRIWLLSYCAFSIVTIIALRGSWRAIMRKQGRWQIATLVVGQGVTADETCHVLNEETSLGYNVVARVKDLTEIFRPANASWRALCHKYKAEHVIVALDGEALGKARQPLAQLMREHVSFSIAPPMHNLSVDRSTPHCFLGRDVMLLSRNSGLDRPLNRFVKRGFDIAISGSALLLLAPVILLAALMVRRDGGKAFFGHKRIGLFGETFKCLKLRSMIANSDEVLKRYLDTDPQAKAEWQRDHKLRRDPRVTGLGRFLRRTSLDELPQLINVLKGEMSIVGPRPIIVAETAKYDSDIAFYYRVRPGITGMWQVSGRNDVTYAERVRMDSWYVRNWTLWNDIAIICKTFSAVFKNHGAY